VAGLVSVDILSPGEKKMTAQFIASCQYDDLKGTIAADQNEAPEGENYLLEELEKRLGLSEKGFSAVGIQYNGPQVDWKDWALKSDLHLVLLATKDSEVTLENYEKYAEEHKHIPVHRFEIDMPIAELLTFFKRLEIRLLAKDWQNLPFKVVSD
jgi:hypothetical protein